MEQNHGVTKSILDLIGDTELLKLGRIAPDDCANIYLKMESGNPTGSMKDRMALAMIEAAEASGKLEPGGHVVDYTGGTTGVSLAQVCRVKGYPLTLVTSDAFSLEKRHHMAALGAELVLVESDKGGMDESLTRRMIEAARKISAETGAYWTDQLNNAGQLPAYHRMGEEIWRQTGGTISAFVQSTGTAASLRGNAERLLDHNPDLFIMAVEPAESAVLSGGKSGAHRIEGVGPGFIAPLWRPDVVTEITTVSTEEAKEMTRHLARTEAVFAGTSTGANLVAAIRLGKRLGPSASIVTVMCDTGMKYLSTGLFDAPSGHLPGST